MTTYAPGSLVRARNRDWVVLPSSTEEFLMLRPLGGAESDAAGLLVGLEPVAPARFAWPDPERAGDHAGARLLRDAARLGFRSSAGPFRSFGQIAVEPRSYQMVPLLMALRLDPVRLLIADDVGIGKTIEAALIAKELLESGTAQRLAVLCPPHLADQWMAELAEKFNIDSEAVLSSTAARLERACPFDTSLFEVYPYTVVSTDFIKSERRREEFLRTAPDLVIVDEAHTCAVDTTNRTGARQQRHQLLAGLAADPTRHLILVTATPHSGNEGAFRSLCALLSPDLGRLVEDEDQSADARSRLSRHLVQRRRADIASAAETSDVFPDRRDLPDKDGEYRLTPAYKDFVEEVLAWARQTVRDESGGRHRQRVRWWGVLGLLRALASSPAAAAATLRNRAAPATTTTEEEADAVGRAAVLDLEEADTDGRPDAAPGADPDPDDTAASQSPTSERRRLRSLAEKAEALKGAPDAKLAHAARLVRKLVSEGFAPIVFCRFIQTAEYVSDELRGRLPKGTEVEAVTGLLPPEERERRVEELARNGHRVLVATDCLSEGINLQAYFDAVVHYDLPWNPTRLEQREGRVDRYGQSSPVVKVATIVGRDNLVDEIVIEVLLRKHKAIRNRLGISIPVPGSNEELIDSVFDRILHREGEQLSLLPPDVEAMQQSLFADWESAADREQASRSRYAQGSVRTDEAAAELAAARAAIGSTTQVRRFISAALPSLGGAVESQGDGQLRLAVRDLAPTVRDVLGLDDLAHDIIGRLELPLRPPERYLGRTSPFVSALASYVVDAALDGAEDAPAARCGAIRTDAVSVTTTLLLLRNRFDIAVGRGDSRRQLLAEALDLAAFAGAPLDPEWLDADAATALLDAAPTANVSPEQRTSFVRQVVSAAAELDPALAARAHQRAEDLERAHRRVRRDAGASSAVSVRPHLPVDVLGVYVLLPA